MFGEEGGAGPNWRIMPANRVLGEANQKGKDRRALGP